MRLLVVEDDPDLNRQLATALTDAGYVVDRAFDGEEAHYLGETEPYDAVILDIGLPKLDGISVLEAWRRSGRAMPVLLLTARDRWSDKVQGFDAGADDYVAKPFHLEEVLARIRALLRRSVGHAKSEFLCGPVRLELAHGPRHRGRRSGAPHLPRIPPPFLPHAPYRARGLPHRAGRASLRPGLRPRLEHHRGVRRPHPQEARGRGHPNRARARLSRLRRPATPAERMRTNSLAFRLFLSATTWTVVILLATGVSLLLALSRGRRTLLRRPSRRLPAHAGRRRAAPEEGGERGHVSLGEPLFELPLSGWYWQITRLNAPKPETRVSRSLWDGTLPHLVDQQVRPSTDGTRRAYVDGPEDQRLRLVERTVDLGEEGKYLVSVAGDPQEIEEELRAFNHTLAITFIMLAAVLLLITMFQVRFGFAPLKRISEGLAAIRAGRAERLEGQFPVEIEPLARETERIDRGEPPGGRAGAHACRQPRACAENAALGDRQRGGRACRRAVRREDASAGRHHARSGHAPPGARALRRPAHRGRRGDRGRAGGRQRSPA